MLNLKNIYIGAGVIIFLAFAALGVWAARYAYDRHAKIAQAEKCNGMLANPPKPEMVSAPDGTLAPLYSLGCTPVVVPPSLRDLLRGRIVFENVPERMKVNSYSLTDILLGRYTFGPTDVGCDQFATTTDCSMLPPPQQGQQPYVPSNPVQPTETWISATGTPISLYGFSFMLPAGWRGSVYKSAYAGEVHALVQSDSNDRGFAIDCPPSGKGLEAATRLSSEERTFAAGGIDYAVAFEEWTASGNDPWYFLWIRTPNTNDSSTGTYCLAQGSAAPDIEEAMRVMYESVTTQP